MYSPNRSLPLIIVKLDAPYTTVWYCDWPVCIWMCLIGLLPVNLIDRVKLFTVLTNKVYFVNWIISSDCDPLFFFGLTSDNLLNFRRYILSNITSQVTSKSSTELKTENSRNFRGFSQITIPWPQLATVQPPEYFKNKEQFWRNS